MTLHEQQSVDSVQTVVTRQYVARATLVDERAAALPIESQAALRQFSLDRIVGYGVDQADAFGLHERVLAGQGWQDAATELADVCEARANAAPSTAGNPTRIAYLRRASALLRMSQVMMLTETAPRREIYASAAELYECAARLAGDRERVTIDSVGGTVVGWLLPATEPVVGSAIVIGGIEGYAMDFDSLGEAMAARGVDTLLLDGPGQGETRFAEGHYLGSDWREAYRSAIDFLDARAPGRPIAIIGNSMGGSIAMAVAAADCRITACCDNGGIPAPWMVPPSIGTFFSKMVAFCGTNEPKEAVDVWATVTPLAPGPNAGYPLLVVHGGADPLVSTEMADALFVKAPTEDKRMVVFSDGNHCVYNHKRDRDVLIADWTRARLGGTSAHDIVL